MTTVADCDDVLVGYAMEDANMSLFDKYLLHQRIEQAEHKATQSQNAITGSQAEIEVLKFYVERLSMITEALWTILKEKHGYSDEDLMKRIGEIDVRDGKLDGHASSGEPPSCPQCKRMHVAKHRPMCLYCGAAMPVPDHPSFR